MVVWAHNSHLGDARATEMGDQGEWNVGQLVRERWGDAGGAGRLHDPSGTVTAASEWDGAAERKRVRPGLPGSYEELFHQAGESASGCRCAATPQSRELLRRAAPAARDRRHLPAARPSAEPLLRAQLPAQFDAIMHIDARGRWSRWCPSRVACGRAGGDLSVGALKGGNGGMRCAQPTLNTHRKTHMQNPRTTEP